MNTLRVAIYDTSIDRTEEYDARWLTTDLYSKLLANPRVAGCDLVGLNDCFAYRFGLLGLPLFALVYIFDRVPFFRHLSKYVFLLIILEGRYLGIWKRDPKMDIGAHPSVRARYTVIAPEFRYPRRSVHDSGMLVLVDKTSAAVSVESSEYVPFSRNDDTECGFIATTMNFRGERLLWIHARLASRPALMAKAYLRGYFSAARREQYISEVLASEGTEIRSYVERLAEHPDIVFSGDLNVGKLENPALQQIIAWLDLRAGRQAITDVLDNTTFFPKPVQATQTYVLVSKTLEYVAYETLPEASFDRSESLVLYTEIQPAAA